MLVYMIEFLQLSFRRRASEILLASFSLHGLSSRFTLKEHHVPDMSPLSIVLRIGPARWLSGCGYLLATLMNSMQSGESTALSYLRKMS